MADTNLPSTLDAGADGSSPGDTRDFPLKDRTYTTFANDLAPWLDISHSRTNVPLEIASEVLPGKQWQLKELPITDDGGASAPAGYSGFHPTMQNSARLINRHGANKTIINEHYAQGIRSSVHSLHTEHNYVVPTSDGSNKSFNTLCWMYLASAYQLENGPWQCAMSINRDGGIRHCEFQCSSNARSKLYEHWMLHFGGSLWCEYCFGWFTSPSLWRNHMVEEHREHMVEGKLKASATRSADNTAGLFYKPSAKYYGDAISRREIRVGPKATQYLGDIIWWWALPEGAQCFEGKRVSGSIARAPQCVADRLQQFGIFTYSGYQTKLDAKGREISGPRIRPLVKISRDPREMLESRHYEHLPSDEKWALLGCLDKLNARAQSGPVFFNTEAESRLTHQVPEYFSPSGKPRISFIADGPASHEEAVAIAAEARDHRGALDAYLNARDKGAHGKSAAVDDPKQAKPLSKSQKRRAVRQKRLSAEKAETSTRKTSPTPPRRGESARGRARPRSTSTRRDSASSQEGARGRKRKQLDRQSDERLQAAAMPSSCPPPTLKSPDGKTQPLPSMRAFKPSEKRAKRDLGGWILISDPRESSESGKHYAKLNRALERLDAMTAYKQSELVQLLVTSYTRRRALCYPSDGELLRRKIKDIGDMRTEIKTYLCYPGERLKAEVRGAFVAMHQELNSGQEDLDSLQLEATRMLLLIAFVRKLQDRPGPQGRAPKFAKLEELPKRYRFSVQFEKDCKSYIELIAQILDAWSALCDAYRKLVKLGYAYEVLQNSYDFKHLKSLNFGAAAIEAMFDQVEPSREEFLGFRGPLSFNPDPRRGEDQSFRDAERRKVPQHIGEAWIFVYSMGEPEYYISGFGRQPPREVSRLKSLKPLPPKLTAEEMAQANLSEDEEESETTGENSESVFEDAPEDSTRPAAMRILETTHWDKSKTYSQIVSGASSSEESDFDSQAASQEESRSDIHSQGAREGHSSDDDEDDPYYSAAAKSMGRGQRLKELLDQYGHSDAGKTAKKHPSPLDVDAAKVASDTGMVTDQREASAPSVGQVKASRLSKPTASAAAGSAAQLAQQVATGTALPVPSLAPAKESAPPFTQEVISPVRKVLASPPAQIATGKPVTTPLRTVGPPPAASTPVGPHYSDSSEVIARGAGGISGTAAATDAVLAQSFHDSRPTSQRAPHGCTQFTHATPGYQISAPPGLGRGQPRQQVLQPRSPGVTAYVAAPIGQSTAVNISLNAPGEMLLVHSMPHRASVNVVPPGSLGVINGQLVFFPRQALVDYVNVGTLSAETAMFPAVHGAFDPAARWDYVFFHVPERDVRDWSQETRAQAELRGCRVVSDEEFDRGGRFFGQTFRPYRGCVQELLEHAHEHFESEDRPEGHPSGPSEDSAGPQEEQMEEEAPQASTASTSATTPSVVAPEQPVLPPQPVASIAPVREGYEPQLPRAPIHRLATHPNSDQLDLAGRTTLGVWSEYILATKHTLLLQRSTTGAMPATPPVLFEGKVFETLDCVLYGEVDSHYAVAIIPVPESLLQASQIPLDMFRNMVQSVAIANFNPYCFPPLQVTMGIGKDQLLVKLLFDPRIVSFLVENMRSFIIDLAKHIRDYRAIQGLDQARPDNGQPPPPPPPGGSGGGPPSGGQPPKPGDGSDPGAKPPTTGVTGTEAQPPIQTPAEETSPNDNSAQQEEFEVPPVITNPLSPMDTSVASPATSMSTDAPIGDKPSPVRVIEPKCTQAALEEAMALVLREYPLEVNEQLATAAASKVLVQLGIQLPDEEVTGRLHSFVRQLAEKQASASAGQLPLEGDTTIVEPSNDSETAAAEGEITVVLVPSSPEPAQAPPAPEADPKLSQEVAVDLGTPLKIDQTEGGREASEVVSEHHIYGTQIGSKDLPTGPVTQEEVKADPDHPSQEDGFLGHAIEGCQDATGASGDSTESLASKRKPSVAQRLKTGLKKLASPAKDIKSEVKASPSPSVETLTEAGEPGPLSDERDPGLTSSAESLLKYEEAKRQEALDSPSPTKAKKSKSKSKRTTSKKK